MNNMGLLTGKLLLKFFNGPRSSLRYLFCSICKNREDNFKMKFCWSTDSFDRVFTYLSNVDISNSSSISQFCCSNKVRNFAYWLKLIDSLEIAFLFTKLLPTFFCITMMSNRIFCFN